MPKDASLDLFLGLYVQVWCLQLLKERARGALLTPCVLALAAAVAFAGAALVRRRHKHEARKAVAAAGLYYLVRRGSSSNHVLLQALLAVAVLEAKDGDALRAYGRQLLGALYGMTALAKLNDGWVDGRGSCVALIAAAGVHELGLPPPPRAVFAAQPYVGIVAEVALAVAFALRSAGRLGSRRWTIALAVAGGAFHVLLAAPRPPLSVYPFSALMAPLFALGLSDGSDLDGAKASLGLALGSVALAEAHKVAVGAAAARVEYPPYVSWDLGLSWCALAFVLVARDAVAAPPRRPARVHRTSLAAMLLLLASALPYVGLRTHPSFIMFSNLRIEGGRSNHWFLSSSVLRRIDLGGGAMADTVIVYKASPAIRDLEVDLGRYMDPRVAAAVDAANASRRFLISPPLGAWPLPDWPAPAGRAAETFAVPFVELRRRVSAAAAAGLDAAVTYERAGARRTFAVKRDGSLAAGSDPLLREPLPAPWRWVYRFRPFDAEGVVHCRH